MMIIIRLEIRRMDVIIMMIAGDDQDASWIISRVEMHKVCSHNYHDDCWRC